jgi:ribosomal protein L31
VWLLVAALTTTFNMKVKSTAEAENEVIAMKCGTLETTVGKSETTIEVAATSHTARTGLPT